MEGASRPTGGASRPGDVAGGGSCARVVRVLVVVDRPEDDVPLGTRDALLVVGAERTGPAVVRSRTTERVS